MKIAIVGAGICGTYLAGNLARKGNKVTVFEKRKTVGKECCSGLFSSRIFEFIPEAKPLATNIINNCVINFPTKSVRLKFNQPFFVIEHAQLDLLSAALASLSGAGIRVNEPVTDFVELEKEFDQVIGCDGALSYTRRHLGLPDPDFMLGVQGFEAKTDKSDTVETWATKNGFIWKIPRGNCIEWGIMEKPEIAPKLFKEFVVKKNIEIGNLKSAIIPQGLILPKNGRTTLCGDASGLTKPWSGGGVVWNLTQARILLKNFPNFLQYRKEAMSFFSLRIFLGKSAKTCAYTAGFKFPRLIPGNISLDGDYLIKNKWKKL